VKDKQIKRPWSIDADDSLQDALERQDCPPLLRRTLTGALSWQARNEVSIRRSLTSPRAATQWLTTLLALGATVTIEDNHRQTEVPLETVVQRKARGRITALHVDVQDLQWGAAHVSRTPADDPIVSAVAVVTIDEGTVRDARVALTGVWPEPVRLARAPAQLAGSPLNQETIQAVAKAVEHEVAPQADFLGSEEYRRVMAGVLTQRALEACLHREAKDE
jgi:CO/xanthine dehydrogenase FAD-binding subunit